MNRSEMSARELIRFFALHKHWIAADAVNYHLRRSIRSDEAEATGLPAALEEVAGRLSAFAVLGVWYGLIYVVIEGYRELGYRDDVVDALLSNAEMLDTLRLFRNATFHFQADPHSHKVLNFLTAEKSELWIRDLNRAFRHFFESVGEIPQWLEAMTQSDLDSEAQDFKPAT